MTSTKQAAHNLIDDIPEERLIYVVNLLQNFKELLIPIVEPDKLDLQMLSEIENEIDKTTVSFSKVLEQSGVTIDDLQD